MLENGYEGLRPKPRRGQMDIQAMEVKQRPHKTNKENNYKAPPNKPKIPNRVRNLKGQIEIAIRPKRPERPKYQIYQEGQKGQNIKYAKKTKEAEITKEPKSTKQGKFVKKAKISIRLYGQNYQVV